MPKVNIIFHSVSGGTFRLAEEIGAGVEEIPTCKANLLRIPEPGGAEPVTMPGLRKINHQFSHVPEATVQDLADCDGLAIGAPNYWGSMSYATKHYLDSAATLWDLGKIPLRSKTVEHPLHIVDLPAPRQQLSRLQGPLRDLLRALSGPVVRDQRELRPTSA